MDFQRQPKDIGEILKFIATTRTGADLLRQFLPFYETGKIRIAHYPAPIVRKLREMIGEDQPIGACFDTDGISGTIHLDPNGILAILAPFLVHEIVHALDSNLWKAAKRKINKTEKDKLILKSEKHAFAFQHQFIEELKQIYPSYIQFLQKAYPKAKILHERLTDKSIAELYGIFDIKYS